MKSDINNLSARFTAVMVEKDELFGEIDRKIKIIGEIIERTEERIENFGKRWVDDV